MLSSHILFNTADYLLNFCYWWGGGEYYTVLIYMLQYIYFQIYWPYNGCLLTLFIFYLTLKHQFLIECHILSIFILHTCRRYFHFLFILFFDVFWHLEIYAQIFWKLKTKKETCLKSLNFQNNSEKFKIFFFYLVDC